MDFLDPKRKKAHRRRLLVGYILVAVAVAMGTLVLLFAAYGYDVNRKTGDVIQNGTVFLDSSPSGAEITLNGQLQRNKTATRLVLPGSQQYGIKLSLEGYRDWNRTFSLEGGKIERLVYALFIPNKLKVKENQLYASAPAQLSQSPDRRWLLVQQPGQLHTFDMYDLENPANAPAVITVPASIQTDPTKTSSIIMREWSNDDRHVLLERVYGDKKEFIMLDTVNAASSININTALTVTPSSITLRDKKYDQLYIYNAEGGLLRLGDTKNRTVSGALLSNVISYKSYGSDIIMYAVKDASNAGKVQVRVRENDKASYLIKSVAESASYLLDIAEYDGTPYYVIGGRVENAAFVYKDPLPTLKGQSQSALIVSAVLRLDNQQFLSFSTNAKFISLQSGKDVIVFDIEGDRQFRVTVPHPVAAAEKIEWIDGFRFAYTSEGQSYVIDFDGSNSQQLSPSVNGVRPFFAPDFKSFFTASPSTVVPGRFALSEVSLEK